MQIIHFAVIIVIQHDSTEFDNIIKHSVKNHSLDVLKIKHLELNEKMEYTVTGAIILILYLESLIQRERKSKPTLHLS